MARHTFGGDPAWATAYRVVETSEDGHRSYSGPYLDKAATKRVAGKFRNQPWKSGYTYTVEEAPLVWAESE